MKTQNTDFARDGIGALLISALLGASMLLGGCAHRSVVSIDGSLPFGPEVQRIRIEMQNGSLGVLAIEASAAANELTYVGGLRRDANTAEGLVALANVANVLSAAMDPKQPGTLVVRCPTAPAGVQGMIAYEGSISIPAAMPLEVTVTNNGHVTLMDRGASSKVVTRRGDLRFERCKGAIEANTGQGMLIAFDHEGDIDVRTGLGDMQVFVVKPGDQITLSTGKGTVQCHVPGDIGCEVDARAEIGRIGNDFGFEVRRVGDYSAAMTGRRGNAKTRVILRTASGHISLIQRKSL